MRLKHVLDSDESLTAFSLLSKVEKPPDTAPGANQVKEIPKSVLENKTRLLLQLMPGLVLTVLSYSASVMLHLAKHHSGF